MSSSGKLNEPTRSRYTLAQQLAATYAASPKLAAVALAGSVARGWADHHSDIELDIYWAQPPSDDERVALVQRAGGRIDIFWATPPSEEEYKRIFARTDGKISQLWPFESDKWSEHYYVRGINIGISGFLSTTIERYLNDVLKHYTTDDERQMRMAAIQHAIPLYGADLLQRWQARIVQYPRELAVALIKEQLAPDEAWWASDMDDHPSGEPGTAS